MPSITIEIRLAGEQNIFREERIGKDGNFSKALKFVIMLRNNLNLAIGLFTAGSIHRIITCSKLLQKNITNAHSCKQYLGGLNSIDLQSERKEYVE